MKPSARLKSFRAARCCLSLFLILGLPPLANPLRAQSPLPDDFNPGAGSDVNSLATQPDGKVVVGGLFTTLGGQPRSRIARLNADGTLDGTFDPGAGSQVNSLAVLADGKILVGGSFTILGGQPRSYLGRLNADGTLDSTFNPGAGSIVNSLTVLADGKVLVGGLFTTLGGQSRDRIGRLNADGTLDSAFNPGASDPVVSLAVQPDGKILVGGSFTSLGGQPRNRIGRLHADGTLDSAFNPDAGGAVSSLVVQPDGKILVGGSFTTLGGQPRNRIGRLNTDGTLDDTFNPGANSQLNSLVVQADGRILVGGFFTTLGGQPRNRIGRLHADGTLDGAFNPGADGGTFPYVTSLAVQADGKILVGGSFAKLAGQNRNRIARLNNTDPATQTLSYDGATIAWSRGGSSPELWRTLFEHSADGLTWTFLGAGARVPGGWQLTGSPLLPTGTLRALGLVAGGLQNASGGIVETTLGVTTSSLRLHATRDGSTMILSWTGGQGPYQVQQTIDLNQPGSWQDVGAPVQGNSLSLPIGTGSLLLRVRGQ